MAVTTSNPILPNINQNNLEKIESFLNDSAYKEALESSANFNTRICIERKMRVPFFDSQTCIAQNHSQLFQPKRNRIPGLLPGQIYSYPRPRWRKKRRQYLILQSRMLARVAEGGLDGEVDLHSISTVENPALQDTDSKDSQLLKDDVTKEWLYDDGDMFEMDGYDEPDPDSDFDYEESSYKRRKARKGGGRGRGSAIDSPSGVSRRGGRGGGRGRKKTMPSYEPVPGDPDKPFACELCGARYKTRPGLTYHYGHSHRDGASDENSRESMPSSSGASSSIGASSGNPGGISFAGQTVVSAGGMGGGGIMGVNSGAPPFGADIIGGPSAPPNLTAVGNNNTPSATVLGPQQVYQDSYVTFLNHPAGTPGRRGRQPANHNQVPPPPIPPPNSEPHPPQPLPPTTQQPPSLQPPNIPLTIPAPTDDTPMPVLVAEKNISGPPIPGPSIKPPVVEPINIERPPDPMEHKPKAAPSPYCDFCLGDSRENKKTGTSEELVSCSDCGRSGHPSCLQFTANMIISVRKYRWQCIECKCCSVCGTSDNDDQLLFCDDCDRGYHMYCLSPALTTPPEGSWSCKLCIAQFHKV